MNRRNVLIGIGTAAVGTGAAFGSGAFTQVEADRAVNVAVAADSNAYVGLNANGQVDAATTVDEELEIQLDSALYSNGGGVNQNALIRVSNESDPADINGTISSESDNAFTIVNQTDSAVTVDLEVDSGSTNELNAHYYDVDGTTSGTVTDDTQADSFNGGEIAASLSANSVIAVAIMVDTDGSNTINSSPQIRVRATN